MCKFGNYYGHSFASNALNIHISLSVSHFVHKTAFFKSFQGKSGRAAIFQPLMIPLMLREAVDRCLFQLPAFPIRPSVCSPLTITELQVPSSLLDLQPGPCFLVARVPFILAAFLCILIFTIEVSGAYRHSYRGYINVLHHSQTNYCSLS
uniref:Uncharacterized protein n=1 Tax=Xenopus tropicalis TaxID=8364 RepID=A0A1B8Y819_XENTR